MSTVVEPERSTETGHRRKPQRRWRVVRRTSGTEKAPRAKFAAKSTPTKSATTDDIPVVLPSICWFGGLLAATAMGEFLTVLYVCLTALVFAMQRWEAKTRLSPFALRYFAAWCVVLPIVATFGPLYFAISAVVVALASLQLIGVKWSKPKQACMQLFQPPLLPLVFAGIVASALTALAAYYSPSWTLYIVALGATYDAGKRIFAQDALSRFGHALVGIICVATTALVGASLMRSPGYAPWLCAAALFVTAPTSRAILNRPQTAPMHAPLVARRFEPLLFAAPLALVFIAFFS